MSSLKPLRLPTRKPLFWLSLAVCAALGYQAPALAAVDAAWSAQDGPSALPTSSTEAEWHGYAPRDVPEGAFQTQAWPTRPAPENTVGSWAGNEQTIANPQGPMPAPSFNEVADWVPPPPGPYPNGPHEGAWDMTPPATSGMRPPPAPSGPMPGYGNAPAGGMPQFGPGPYRGPGMPWQNAPRPSYGTPSYGGAPAYGPPAYGPPPGYGAPTYGPRPGYGAPVNPMYGPGYPPMGYPQGPNDRPSPAYGRPNWGPMPMPMPNQGMPWQNTPRPAYGPPNYGPNPYATPSQYGPPPGYGYP